MAVREWQSTFKDDMVEKVWVFGGFRVNLGKSYRIAGTGLIVKCGEAWS